MSRTTTPATKSRSARNRAALISAVSLALATVPFALGHRHKQLPPTPRVLSKPLLPRSRATTPQV